MRLTLVLFASALLSACYTARVYSYPEPLPPPPPPPPVAYAPGVQVSVRIGYWDYHPIPHEHGDGWCTLTGLHYHVYEPYYTDQYVYRDDVWYFGAPVHYRYEASGRGHPIPVEYGGGWCNLHGPHTHSYRPWIDYSYDYTRRVYVYRPSNTYTVSRPRPSARPVDPVRPVPSPSRPTPSPARPSPSRPTPSPARPTPVPTRPSPTTPAPTRPSPTTPAPTRPSPTTPAPTRPSPAPTRPGTPAPTRPSPTTPAPTPPGTPSPTRPSPATPAPTRPGTPSPTRPSPTAPAPTRPSPATPTPSPISYGDDVRMQRYERPPPVATVKTPLTRTPGEGVSTAAARPATATTIREAVRTEPASGRVLTPMQGSASGRINSAPASRARPVPQQSQKKQGN